MAFVNPMIQQSNEDGVEAVIAMTGSRAGITTPPGDTAYNVGKALVEKLKERARRREIDSVPFAHPELTPPPFSAELTRRRHA